MVMRWIETRISVPCKACSSSSVRLSCVLKAMFMAVVHLAILHTASSSGLNSIDDLREFFKTTYIRKQVGQMYRDPRNDAKLYYAEMFNPSWGFYRFHHVCLRGGSDGIFVGMDGVQSTTVLSEGQVSAGEWNDLIGSRFNDPLTAYILEDSTASSAGNPSYFRNSTLFINCNRQHSFAFNPSLFMSKLGFLYELGACLAHNLGRAKVFKKDILLPFKQIFMHQCPNPESSRWHWGLNTWHIIEKRLSSASLFNNNRTDIIRRGHEANYNELLCFEDLYLSARQGHWLQGKDNLMSFRRDAAAVSGEPNEAKSHIERAPLPSEGGRLFQAYCNQNGTSLSMKEILNNRLAGTEPPVVGKPTSARIVIFQRTGTASPRSFTNLQEVVDFLQMYTTVPVKVVTVTERNTIQEQIRLFNSFDIMVTVHGSHLTNGIYTMHPHRKAMVEIAPFLFDPMYFKNYNEDLGFAEYIVSTGHLTPHASVPSTSDIQGNNSAFCAFTEFADFMNRDCKIERKINSPKVSQDWITCATGLHSRGCDVYVNTTILKTHMDLLIKESLCRLEQKKDFLDSLMSPRGNGVDIEQSEDYTEYASLPGKESFGSSKSDDGTLSSGGDVAVKPIVEQKTSTADSRPVHRTKEDLKNMLLKGLDGNKASSEFQEQPSSNLPRAADTTDGSAGFNSGGDVADITSDVPEISNPNGVSETQGQLHVYTEQTATQSLHPKALQPDLPSESQNGPVKNALETDTPSFTGNFASGGDPEVYSNEGTIKIPPLTSATPANVDANSIGFNSGGDVNVGGVTSLDDLITSVQPESQAARVPQAPVTTDQQVSSTGMGDVMAMMEPNSIEQRTVTGGAYPKSRKRMSSSFGPGSGALGVQEPEFVQPVPLTPHSTTLRRR